MARPVPPGSQLPTGTLQGHAGPWSTDTDAVFTLEAKKVSLTEAV